MGITIKELSEISGYSTATISRVISNKGNVKESTRKEITNLLLKYNYRTSMMEVHKSAVNNRTIMVIVGDMNNWYYMEIFKIISGIAVKNDYFTIIAYTDNNLEMEELYLNVAISEKYAGVIFMNVRGGDKIRDLLKENDFPAAFLNRGIKHAYFNTVINDNYQGAYQATEYLIKAGHKKIGHLAGSYFSHTAAERYRGYTDAMHDNGLVVTKNSIYQGNIDWKSGYTFGQEMIKKNLDFTALFISAYQMTEGLLDCFMEYGVNIPEDISIISFDETPDMKRHDITTICAEPEKMGRTAMNLLMEQIHDHKAERKSIQFEPVLNIRKSVKVIK
ncbi:MAG: LacI family DNA-binding transcriptional regulator [Lachnospiraceae bacterium]|nr:LacI family DNA-binding transcriptional regulator [Lachnospiraceae bacterium]MDD3617504.1 LacI family DNA-binding transcriptional regulator [Lachnospiraceae bacterium]